MPAKLVLTGVTSGTSFTLGGANTYTGGTVMSVNTGTGGNVFVGSDTAFGAGKVTNILVPGTSSPQFQAQGGTRTLANAFDLNGGLTFTGTNSFVFTGPITIINAAAGGTRTLNNTITAAGTSVTFGAGPGSSTITVGNPVTNGGDGVGKGLVLSGSTGSTIVVNAVMQDPAAGGGAAAGSVTIGGTGTVGLNALSTYSGGTTLNGAGTIIPIGVSSNALPGSSFTAGPFGTGQINVNNGTNQHLRPVGDQTISNAILMTTGFAMDNATGDASSLTFAGPITMTNNRFISNGFAAGTAGGTMIVGVTGAPSTITLPASGTLTLSFAALAGPIVVNDVIQNAAGQAGNVSINPNAGNTNAVTLNGANTYTGTTTLAGGSVLLGVSSVGGPGSITSGPFGTGAVVTNNTSAPPILVPVGADRTVANAITMTSGFFAANAAGTTFNLSLTGPITLGATGRTITNNMVAGAALTLGSSAAPSTVTLGSTLTVQSQQTAAGAGTTIVNGQVTGAGGLTVQVGGTVQLTNGQNNYSGATSVTGGRLLVSNPTGSATGTSAVTVTGSGAVGSGGTLGGTGAIGGNVTISSTTATSQGGALSPGTANNIGTLSSGGTLTLNPLGNYLFKYNAAATAPVAGTDNDTVNPPGVPAGTLNLANLSAASPFTVALTAVGSPASATPVTYTAGSFSSVTLPAGFSNPGDVTSLFSFTGQFAPGSASASVNGGTLTFTFTPVPEPAHVLLVCGAATAGLGWWRRRRA